MKPVTPKAPRALIVTLPEKGHYNPLLGPAEALTQRGVDVAFAVTDDIGDALRAAGAPRVFVPPGAGPPSDTRRGQALARLLRDPVALQAWIRQLVVDAPGRGVDPLRAIIRDFRPDVVAIDTMAYDGAIAAELEHVPWVGWSTSLNPVVPDTLDSQLIATLRQLDRERMRLFAAFGVPARFRVSDVLSARGTAVFTTAALVGAAPAQVELVGPSLRSRRLGERVDPAGFGGRPLLYVAFGSQAWYQPHRFDRVLEAAERLGFAVLAAMGDLADTYRARALPPHVQCVGFASQLDALEHARVLVTHGGANSVMEALSFGVPLAIAPICNDQPHNLHFVQHAGAGRHLDLDGAGRGSGVGAGIGVGTDIGPVVETLRALASAGPERASAGRIARSYAAHSGAQGAADMALRACR